MDDSRIKVFLAASAEGSFTRAAASLGISQPAVSQNIAELEKFLGVRLFVRERGSVSLTPEGERFMLYARRLESDYGLVDAVFSPSFTSSGRIVRIATTDFLWHHVLPGLLKDFPLEYKVSYISNSYPMRISDMPDDYDLCIYTVPEGEAGEDPVIGRLLVSASMPSGSACDAFSLSVRVKASEEFERTSLCKLLLTVLSSR